MNTLKAFLRLLSQGHEPDHIPISKNYSPLFVTNIFEHIPNIFEVTFSGTTNLTLSQFAKIIHRYSLQPFLNTFQAFLRLLSQGHEPDPIPISKNYSLVFVTNIFEHIPRGYFLRDTNLTLSLLAKIIHCYSLQTFLNTFQAFLRLLSQGHEPDPIPISKNYSLLFVTNIFEHIPSIFEVTFSGTRT